MAFWRRIAQSKLKPASHLVERWCLQAPCGSSPRGTATVALLMDIRGRGNLGFYSDVRFFAAPVQAKPKEEEDRSGRRINEQIKAREVRVVTDEGHYVVPLHQALQEARRLKLDLVEVQRDSNPPVVKIMDFHMERYKQQLHEKERAKTKGKLTVKQGVLKEVRFTVKTEAKDLAVKADGIKRLMDRGYRVKCMATGTEDQDLGGLLSRMITLIEDVAHVDSGPTVEKRQAFVIVRHIKFGTSKKGGKKMVDLSAEIQQQQAALAQSDDRNPIPEGDLPQSLSEETEEESFSDEDMEPKKNNTGRPMHAANFDPPKVFDSRSRRSLPSDFQRPEVQTDTAPAQQVPENRYARKTDKGRRFPPRHPVDKSSRDQFPRDSVRFDPNDRAGMPSDMPRQDWTSPNFSRSARVLPPKMQRPDGPSPRDAGQSFGIFSTGGSNVRNG
ncbi:hypothetical protein SAY87_022974 [Trapa incisa]|uniref:Translation initiation factor 3 N-terminal domain-containing protein n=1 Tax=Trapa incisa TaxID=236973 RepID=A0AAN7Q5M0_9MYRT|nr:hypothetical protein SAY87_022974 [Trapa incisa]